MKIPSWTLYAGGEGLTKTVNSSFAKLMGVSRGAEGVLYVSLVIGMVQSIGGLVGALVRREPLIPTYQAVFGSFVFGLSAFGMTVLSLYSFTYEGADVGITTFITTFTVVVGLIIDRVFFKTILTRIQWLGMLVFFLAGYAMLNFPPLSYLVALPMWVLLSFVVALLGGLNEGITRGISRVTFPFANNFWIGATTATCSLLGIVLVGVWQGAELFRGALWYIPFIMGCVTLTMISFKLLTYKNGGTIAVAKVVMFGTYLIGATIAGVIFFDEPMTLGKIVGIIGFFVAFSLTDRETFQVIKNHLV